MKAVSQRAFCMPVCNAAWQTKSQAMQSSRMSRDEWIGKKMGYYSAIKRMKSCIYSHTSHKHTYTHKSTVSHIHRHIKDTPIQSHTHMQKPLLKRSTKVLNIKIWYTFKEIKSLMPWLDPHILQMYPNDHTAVHLWVQLPTLIKNRSIFKHDFWTSLDKWSGRWKNMVVTARERQMQGI